MLFQLVLTKVFKSELFSCLPKVDHVIRSCKTQVFSFRFPHWVMKNVLFPKVITIFKLIYLWNKLFLDLALLASRRLPLQHVFSARFPRVVLLGRDNLFIPRHFQRLLTGKLTGVDPGRPRNLQKRKVEQ